MDKTSLPMLRLTVVLLVVAVPLATAGTESDPELSDPSGDYPVILSATPGVQEALDLVAVWINETAENFTLHWKVTALARSGDSDRLQYSAVFQAPVGETTVIVWRQGGDTEIGGGLWTGFYPCAHTADGTATLEFDEANATISLMLPRSCLDGADGASDSAGTSLTDLWAYAYHCNVDVSASCVCIALDCPAGALWDSAGPGRPFEFALRPDPADAGPSAVKSFAKESPGPGILQALSILLLAGAGARVCRQRRL